MMTADANKPAVRLWKSKIAAFEHCAQRLWLQVFRRSAAAPWPNSRDVRIKAIVIAAPALGFAFSRSGLADVHVPVQLWRADDDKILPAPFYADAVRAALPRRPEFHTVLGAGHFDFLAPCVATGSMPQICQSAPGFNRAAFHASFDAEVVRFFTVKLTGKAGSTAAARR